MQLSTAALQAARNQMLGTLTDTCTINRTSAGTTRETDDYGAPKPSAGTSTTSACRVTQMSGREAADVTRVAEGSEYKFTLPHGTLITRTATITWRNRTFPVTGIKEATIDTSVIVYTAAGY